MASRDITDELVSEIVRDLRDRYELDDDDVRAVGARLVDGEAASRTSETTSFARRFIGEHRATFDRLGQ